MRRYEYVASFALQFDNARFRTKLIILDNSNAQFSELIFVYIEFPL